MLKLKTLVVVLLSITIQSCSTNMSSSQEDKLGGIIIPEPSPVDFKHEAVISRLNDIIQRADISDVQRAELYYERGIKHDSVGLRYLARLDFNHALRLKPNHADAYNFLGIHLTQIQEFHFAYDAFDSAIELVENHEYAYFNRGIALYYGARPKLAIEDFEYFYNHEPSDAFRMLWLYLAEVNIDPVNAKAQLMQRSESVSDDLWVKNILDLYLGSMSQQAFIESLSIKHVGTLDKNEKKQLNERLCEAYFYLGKYNLLMGNNADAEMFFKLALSTNIFEYVEHRYAQLELDLLGHVAPARY